MKPDPGEPTEQPGPEPGSVQQEARTCPVCGTKFFATADREFCPVCILRGATSGESAAAGESGQYLGWQQPVLRRLTVGRRLDGLTSMK